MIGYSLVTYGPKPTGKLSHCKAARQQVRNLYFAAEKLTGKQEFLSLHDYARKVPNIDALPKLKSLLIRAKVTNTTIYIDTYLRLFAKCPLLNRQQLFKDLQEYSGHFRDLHSKEDIGSLSAIIKVRMLTAESPVNFALQSAPRSFQSPKKKLEQTRKATQASQVVRSGAADSKARELNDLRDVLNTETDVVSMSELARIANERGLKTSTGGGWSNSTVQRALKRLTEHS